MTNPQPLVLAYFKLPPKHESFSRIHDTLWSVFVPQLENLSTALQAAQAIQSSPNATKILHEARNAAVDEVDKLWDYFQIVEGIASRYIEFLDYLSQNNLEEERYAYRTACLLAQAGTADSGKAQQVMTNFREGIESALSRIISIMAGDGKDMSSLINESSKVLAEIGGATDECNELLRECSEDFARLEKQDFDEESFLRNPSWEEHQLVLQKWREFAKTVGSLWVGWSKLKNGIRGDNRHFKQSDNTPGEDSRNFSATTGNPNAMGLNASALATRPHPSPSNKAKIPFWRKTLRRLMPCLSSKPFR